MEELVHLKTIQFLGLGTVVVDREDADDAARAHKVFNGRSISAHRHDLISKIDRVRRWELVKQKSNTKLNVAIFQEIWTINSPKQQQNEIEQQSLRIVEFFF